MNKVFLQGRLTKDIELRYSGSDSSMAVGRFTLAVNRQKKGEADFITCTAFGKTAENINKFFHKGSLILICGSIQTGSYTNKEGKKVYTTDVVINEFNFTGEKSAKKEDGDPMDGFMDTSSKDEEELVFN